MSKSSKTTPNFGNKPKIVFLGSGPVAAKSLEFLTDNFEVELVVTKPASPRSKDLPPVLAIAQSHDLAIVTVTSKNEVTTAVINQRLQSRLGIVVDFGFIIEPSVINYFGLGIVNSHFSLLPQWRGADPITFALLSGQPKTGVSLMLINERLDEGRLITQKSLPIQASDNNQTLTTKLIELSNQLMADYLPRYIAGEIKPHQQPHPDRATYSRKLTKEDGLLDFNKSAEELERQIRAFSGWPKSYTKIKHLDLTILEAEVCKAQLKPGQIHIEGKRLLIGCAQNSLNVKKLQPAGKPAMTIEAFLAGYKNKLS